MTANLADTIKGLKEMRQSVEARIWPTGQREKFVDTIDAALTALRSQEGTVRRCAEICRSKAAPGTTGREPGSRNAASQVAHECAAAILAAHGLKFFGDVGTDTTGDRLNLPPLCLHRILHRVKLKHYCVAAAGLGSEKC